MADPALLVDTNICIYVLLGQAPEVRRRIEQYAPGDLGVSSISFAEVMVGARTLRSAAEAEAFFRIVSVCPFDEAAALAYASLPFKRGSFDRLIAAHALALDIPLATNNERDFADIPGLRLENWIKA